MLNAFLSPTEVASATIEEIEAIEGIGRDTAKHIWDVFHGETRQA